MWNITISKGPEILLDYEGAEVPGKVKDDIRKIWMDSLTEAPAIRGAEARLLKYFRDHGYLKVKVTHREDSPDADTHRFVFVIEHGAKYKDPDWQIHGRRKGHDRRNPQRHQGQHGRCARRPRRIQETRRIQSPEKRLSRRRSHRTRTGD